MKAHPLGALLVAAASWLRSSAHFETPSSQTIFSASATLDFWAQDLRV